MDFRDREAGGNPNFFWFKGKQELISILLEKTAMRKPCLILDVGAGTGNDLQTITSFGETYVVDADPRALALIDKNLVREKLVARADLLPYKNEMFDLAVAFDVLEHIDNDTAAIQEIRRVLKTGGFLIFTVPAFGFLFSAHDRALKHFRRYTKNNLRQKLAGFSEVELSYWLALLFAPIAIKKLLERKRPEAQTHSFKLNPWLNNIFSAVMRFENWLIAKGLRLPAGITLYGIYKKI